MNCCSSSAVLRTYLRLKSTGPCTRSKRRRGREFLCPPRRRGRRWTTNRGEGERGSQTKQHAVEFLGVYLPRERDKDGAIKRERESERRFIRPVNGRLVVVASSKGQQTTRYGRNSPLPAQGQSIETHVAILCNRTIASEVK